jgi:TusA-related sulfurtransferase
MGLQSNGGKVMKIIIEKRQTPLQRINSIGEAMEIRKKLEELKKNEKVNILTKKQLEGLNVSKITKEQALEAWNEVKLRYEQNE